MNINIYIYAWMVEDKVASDDLVWVLEDFNWMNNLILSYLSVIKPLSYCPIEWKLLTERKINFNIDSLHHYTIKVLAPLDYE